MHRSATVALPGYNVAFRELWYIQIELTWESNKRYFLFNGEPFEIWNSGVEMGFRVRID
jgi:hypothetical protein